MKLKHLTIIRTAALGALSTLPLHAQVTWDGEGDGTTWGDDANWVGDAEPTSSDSIALNGATVTVDTSDATYSTGGSGNIGSTININSGGVLTAVGGNFNTLRFFTAVNVNAGGSYVDQDASTTLRSPMTIAENGSLFGLSSIREGITLSIGGNWQMLGNTSAAAFSWSQDATVDLLSTGTVEFDLYGDNSNDSFDLTNAGAVLNLASGNIVLTTQGGYTPQPGDSFDLWDNTAGGSITPGDGSNITLTGYTLDVSQFATDGTVSVIPEPSTYALFIGLTMLVGATIRRRQLR